MWIGFLLVVYNRDSCNVCDEIIFVVVFDFLFVCGWCYDCVIDGVFEY